MRTSHLAVRKRILAEKDKITDEQFFTSRAYRAYLMDITEGATHRYKRPLRVMVGADPSDETVAYTDMQTGFVYINACNQITWSMPTRWLRSLSIVGLNAHENGHNLFTDYQVWNTYWERLAKGRFFPHMPRGLNAQQKLNVKEIREALLDDTDKVPQQVILQTAKTIENILEDGYVEARYAHEFPGVPARGIALNNVRFAEQMPEIMEMINRQFYDHTIVLNLLIQYVRSGEVNNLSGYQGELMDMMLNLLPFVDDCLVDEDARARCEATTRILIELWPLMQRCFDPLREIQQQAQQQQQNQQTGSSGETETNSEDPEANPIQAVEEELESQMPNLPPNPEGTDPAVPSSGKGLSAIPSELMDELEELLESLSRNSPFETGDVEEGGNGGLTKNDEYEGAGYEHVIEDMERILEETAETQVHESMEEELTQELQQEASQISYGNAHRGISVTVNRMTHIDPDLVDAYTAVAPDLLALSKRLQRSVGTLLQDKREGGKQSNLLAGRRLNQHALYRDDGRIFYNTRLPTEPINLAVGLLVDESGSMYGNRITKALATAIVVQDFCERLGIPITIMGHTADDGHVDLYSYAEFDSVDRNDRYRLMDMNARVCNRDGAALRFMAEKLYLYPAEVKLLIVICDGQPNDMGYSGLAAEADLRGIRLEYARKGVQIFAAAIGDDREQIERIYGAGYLDITDLSKLPVMLTNLISRNLPL